MAAITPRIIALFSGQGSQYRGMGRRLYTSNASFQKSVEASEKLVRKLLNRSLLQELYQETQEPFDDLLITHPAIVAVEIAMLKTIEALGIRIDCVNGNSLGEFAAAVASGICTAETALVLAIEQAKDLVSHNRVGGMLAVMDTTPGLKHRLCTEHNVYLAADNFPGHFTLSGKLSEIEQVQVRLKRAGTTYWRLPVNYAFHSPIIQVAQDFPIPIELSSAKINFVSGCTGREEKVIPRTYFSRVVRSYTNFSKLVAYLEQKGPFLYLDLGPSGTSANFVKYNLPASSRSRTFQIMTPFLNEEEQLKKLVLMFESNFLNVL